MAVSYGQKILWTDRYGTQSVGVSGCETREEALRHVLEMAKERGWTPPRWWQFWRWNDTRLPDNGNVAT